MTPPINNPDGSGVSEIVLPDGSTASEVVAPDGSTVYSAIPDSVTENSDVLYWMDEGSSGTLSDTQSNVDGSLAGSYQWLAESTSPTSKDAITDYGGSDAQGYSDTDSALFNGSQQAVAFWVNMDERTTNNENVLGINTTQGSGANYSYDWTVTLNDSSASGGNEGPTIWTDGTSNNATVSVSDIYNSWFFIAVSMDGSYADIYVYDSSSFVGSANTTDGRQNTGLARYLEWMRDGSDSSYLDGQIAMIMAQSGTISQSDFDQIHSDTQPQ